VHVFPDGKLQARSLRGFGVDWQQPASPFRGAAAAYPVVIITLVKLTILVTKTKL
jgi:hypothetical protein